MFLDIGRSAKAAVTSHQFPPHGYPRVHIHGPTVSRVSPAANRWTPSESVGLGLRIQTQSPGVVGVPLGRVESRAGPDSAGRHPQLVPVLASAF